MCGMLTIAIPLLFAQSAAAQVAPAPAPDLRSPAAIIDAAPAAGWRPIADEDLAVMVLPPAADGAPRQVVIQLLPVPIRRAP